MSIQKANINKALRVIKEIRKHHPDMQTQAVQTFLEIVLTEGSLTVSQVADRLGMAVATASRNVDLLGKVHRSGLPGLDWIRKEQGDDPRTKILSLTPKGRLVAESISEILD